MPKLTFGLIASLSCLLMFDSAHGAEMKTGVQKLREAQTEFRVCATPGNLPFTDKAGKGFDNKIAELIAGQEGKPLSYAWAEPGHGFLRQTLNAWNCDVVMSVPTGFGGPVVTTKPYYCSKYVELRRKPANAADANKIGVVVSTPPLDILLREHRDPQVYLPNDPTGPDYMGRIGSDLLSGRIDAAYVWGPVAAKYVKEAPDKFEISSKDIASPDPKIRTVFPISMAVRRTDESRLESLNTFIANDGAQIRQILDSYGVPLAEGPHCAPPKHEASLAPKTFEAASSSAFSRNIVKIANTPSAPSPQSEQMQSEQNIHCSKPKTLEEIGKIQDNAPKSAHPLYTVQDGKAGPKTYSGWIRFSLNCERCHGPGGIGSAIAPDLTQAVKGLNKLQFQTILTCGLVGNIGAGVMPSWKDNPNVMPYLDNLWAYLKARSDGVLAAGRPEKLQRSAQKETSAGK